MRWCKEHNIQYEDFCFVCQEHHKNPKVKYYVWTGIIILFVILVFILSIRVYL